MSPRARLIVAAVVSVVVLVAFFLFAIRPRQSELGDVRDQIEEEEARELQLQAELDRLRDLQAREPELRAGIEEIRQFVPRRHEVANFIFQVQNAANRSGLEFLEITPELPAEPPEGAQVAEVRHEIRAEGGFFAIQDFIRRLYRLDRALRIDVLNLAGQEQEEEFTIDVSFTARIFFELPEVQAPAAPTPTPEPEDEEDQEDEGLDAEPTPEA